jgi:hypothetical protein
MVSPAQKIRLVRENLALALALWRAAKNGNISHGDLIGQSAESIDGHGRDGDGGSAPNALDRVQEERLTRRAGNQVRASFALSVIQTQQSLDLVFPADPLDEEAPDLQAARCAMYLMHNAVAGDMFSPVWECPPRYRRFFEVRPIRFTLDANEIQGRGLNWDHFGGLDKYLYLLDYCEAWAEQPRDRSDSRQSESATAAVTTKINNSMRRPSLFPEIGDAPMGATDSVEVFISTRCELGEAFRSTAKDLYANYVGWCKEAEQQPIAQRSFGMRLTGLGLERRRRGRGKHWWEGIRLAGAPELMVTERRNGAH